MPVELIGMISTRDESVIYALWGEPLAESAGVAA